MVCHSTGIFVGIGILLVLWCSVSQIIVDLLPGLIINDLWLHVVEAEAIGADDLLARSLCKAELIVFNKMNCDWLAVMCRISLHVLEEMILRVQISDITVSQGVNVPSIFELYPHPVRLRLSCCYTQNIFRSSFKGESISTNRTSISDFRNLLLRSTSIEEILFVIVEKSDLNIRIIFGVPFSQI